MNILALVLLGEEEALRLELLNERIPRWIARLDDRERDVLILRLGLDGREPMTLERIGARWGVGGVRAAQIYHRALRRLRWYAQHDHHRLDPPWRERSEIARRADRSRSELLRRGP